MKKEQITEHTGIKKENALLLIFISLVIGFVGGVVFSAFKTVPTISAPGAMPPNDHQSESHIAALEEAVAKDPKNMATWIELGNHFFDSQQFDKAINAYTSALKIQPNNANVWTDLGVMYRRKGESQAALNAFKKAHEIDPRHEVSLFNAGVVLMHDLKKPDEARAMWQKLLTINPAAKAPSGQPVRELLDKMK